MEFLISVIGAALAIINGLVLFILSGIKSNQKDMKESNEANQKDMWERIYNHYHEIECGNADCKKLRTGNVVVPQGK